MMCAGVVLFAFSFAGGGAAVQSWIFDDPVACERWVPNAYLSDVVCRDGILHARATGFDPYFTCDGLSLDAKTNQYVLLRIKASAPGRCQLFWTGNPVGAHGGFTEEKSVYFALRGNDFEEVVVPPYWHAERHICKLRLDLYDGAEFEIHSIQIVERGKLTSEPSQNAWDLSDTTASGWVLLNHNHLWLSPPLDISTDEVGWAIVMAQAQEDTVVALHWATDTLHGARQGLFRITKTDVPKYYYSELEGHPEWKGKIIGAHLSITLPQAVTIQSFAFAKHPIGPPELEAAWFHFEDGIPRADRDESLLLQLRNSGGTGVSPLPIHLTLPPALSLTGGPVMEGNTVLAHGNTIDVFWKLRAEKPGTYEIKAEARGGNKTFYTTLDFLPPLSITADYVPMPSPIQTTHDVLAYYFPGWDAPAKWDCIRLTAPIRRPLLGYYDESNPECVDWQIKWAVENGISCFLVDWYWCQGRQSLLHWFDAYRRARYRDLLKVAIMWANHNPPGTHSREDFRAVTKEWISKYFILPSYYRINNQPAVFIWDAKALRKDLGGTEALAEAITDAQRAAEQAGYSGIAFVSLQHHITASETELLASEGYHGHTSYHEWGTAYVTAPIPQQGRYTDIVQTAPAAWERKRILSNSLTYYPVVDTGWDSRPWHGNEATAFYGRTVNSFRQLLEAARDYCNRYNQKIVILGPLNEWGEGSYIEPNVEFGFGMYEALREVFGLGNPSEWPLNFSPRDVGLGPYDLPRPNRRTAWDFSKDSQGWAPFMNIADFQVTPDGLCFSSSSPDPALLITVDNLNASTISQFVIRMQVLPIVSETTEAQLFWASSTSGFSESASVRFAVPRDGKFHDYQIPLSNHRRWRGNLQTLRFDPCDFSGASICIASIALIP